MAGGVQAGRLNIEIVADIARLQADLDKTKRLVKAASGDIAASARAANDNLANMGKGLVGTGGSAKLAGHQLQNLTFQLNDVAVGFASGQKPMTIFMQQGAQIGQIMAQAGVGIGGMVKQVAGIVGRFAMAHPVLLGVATAAGLAFAGLNKFKDGLAKPGEIEAYAKSLGMTTKEIEKAGGAAVTWGDLMSGVWKTISEGLNLGPIFDTIKSWGAAAFKFLAEVAAASAAGLYAAFVGSFNALQILWQRFPAIIGNLLGLAANLGIAAVEGMVQKGIDGINSLIRMANSAVAAVGLPWKIGELGAANFGRVAVQSAGAAGAAAVDMGAAYSAAYKQARVGMSAFGAEVSRNTVQASMDRLKAADIENDADKKGAKAKKEKAEKLSELEKAYKSAAEAAEKYIDSLAKEIALIGKSAQEKRMYELHNQQALITQAALATGDKAAIANAQRLVVQMGLLAAVRDRDTKAQEEQVAASKRLAEAIKNFLGHLSTMEKLRGELSLIGLVGAARERAVLALEKEAVIRDKGLKAWKEYEAIQLAIIAANEKIVLDEKATQAFLDSLDEIANRAADVGSAMEAAFGGVGGVIGDAVAALADYQAVQADLAKSGETQAQQEFILAGIRARNTSQMLGGIKSLFKEHSVGYKVMSAIEKAYAAFQFANMIKSIVMDTTRTATEVANSGVRATAKGAEGAATIFSQLGAFGFPVVAAMVAVLAALGISGLSRGGGASFKPPSAEDLQKSLGTGTVLGAPDEKSASIANALEIMANNSNEDLEFSSETVRHLRAIEQGIGGLTAAIARQINVSGGAFDTSGLGIGTNSSGGLLGIGGLFSSTKTSTMYDQGLKFFQSTVADILMQGVDAQIYSVIQTVKKSSGFLGIGGSTKTSYSTVTGAAPAQIEQQFQLILNDVAQGVIAFGKQLGLDVTSTVANTVVPTAQLSFLGMSGEEIQSALEAYFSSVADAITTGAFGAAGFDLAAFQKAGEGLFETLARITRTMATVSTSLDSIGMGGIGGDLGQRAAASDSLAGLFGGLDSFQDAVSSFSKSFLTEAEQMAPVIAAVHGEMARLGQATVTTKDQFKALVLGLDLSSDAGREMFAALLAVAPAFAKVDDWLVKIGESAGTTGKTLEHLAAIEKQRRSLEIDLMIASGDALGALAAKRADDLAAMDELNRALQQQVWAAQDSAKALQEYAAAATAWAAKAEALAKQQRSLEIDLMTALGDAEGALAAQRADALAALPETLRALQQQIWTAQDATAAATALATAQQAQADIAAAAAQAEAQAAADILAAARALADQRRGLEIELMDAIGDAEGALAARRLDQIAALDASLRPLQEQIFAAQDAATAAEALARAQEDQARAAEQAATEMKRAAEEMARAVEEAARAAEQLARQRAGLEIDLVRALGDETGALAAQRQLELATLDPTLRALQQQVWSALDATAAQKALADAQAEATRVADDAAKAAAQRVTDARSVLVDAYKREAGALGDTIDKFTAFGASLRDFRAGIFATNASMASSYRTAQVKLMMTGALAQAGDVNALGSLQGVAQTFLDASRARATSQIQLQRDQATVARMIDAAIGATDGVVNTAQASLTALQQLVAGQIETVEAIIGVPEALAALLAAEAGYAAPTSGSAWVSGMSGPPSDNPEVQALREEVASLRSQISGQSSDISTIATEAKLTNRTLTGLIDRNALRTREATA